MFTGTVKGLCRVSKREKLPGLTRYAVEMPNLLSGLEHGASVSIDGVCQTVVNVDKQGVWFEAISETLERTTLKSLEVGRYVNVERSAKFGDEIGGHILSGHVYCTAPIIHIEKDEHNCKMTVQIPPQWSKYLFYKGFIALDGVSLTVGEVSNGKINLYLIPETLKLTTFGTKKEGDLVNVELDAHTLTIVATVEKVLAEKR